jgi:hypothetical protein
MGVGHAAIALGAAKAVPRVNAGWLVFAAFLADFLLGVYATLGLEQAHVPAGYATLHYLTFTFPYSHGLVPLLLYGLIFGAALSGSQKPDRGRVFLVVASVVLSHFVLDALVHVAGLPLFGENSPKIAFGLWRRMPLELSLETLMAIAGTAIYFNVRGAASSPVSRWGVAIFMVLLTALTWTQLFIVTAPVPAQLIPSWIGGPLLFGVVVYALDRKRAASGEK